MNSQSYFYPYSQATTEKIASWILLPIKRDESVNTVWVPMSGRRMVSKFIVEEIALFKEIFPDYKKYLLVYVEPLELTEESTIAYFRLLAKSLLSCCLDKKKYQALIDQKDRQIFTNEELSLSQVINSLSFLIKKISKSGLKIVFFLGEFDELSFVNRVFYNQLKLLWLKFSPQIQFVFLNHSDISRPERISSFGDLNEVLLQNLIYIPLFREETDYLVARNAFQLGKEFSQAEKDLIKELCGTHPYSIKVACRFLARFDGQRLKIGQLRQELLNHFELNAVSRGVLKAQTKSNQEILKKVAQGESLDLLLEGSVLEKLGLVYKTDKKWQVYGTIFAKNCTAEEKSRLKTESKEDLIYDVKKGTIIFRGNSIEEKFTRQEFNVLSLFLKELTSLKTRDDLGEVLWGKNSYEKYSDWAIDQLISKLRKKIEQMGSKSKIVTLRGRGYKFINAS